MLRPGSVAPSFEATLHTGETFRLDDLRNKSHLVLYFYPRDFTFGCTREACLFRDHADELKRLGATVLGVSPDPPERHEEFAKRHRLDFSLISDSNHDLAKLYHVTLLNGLITLRVTYVVDKYGIVRGAFHHELRIGSHSANTLQILRELQENI